MTLIKLHFHRATVNEKRGGVVYINVDHIVSISEFGEGSCVQTVTDIEEGRAYYVQETPKQVIKRIEAAREYPPLRLGNQDIYFRGEFIRLKGDKYEIQSME
jgi:hypothetical protein